MAASLWPLFRLARLFSFLGMTLTCLLWIGESHAVKILRISPAISPSFNPPTFANHCAAHIDQYEKEHRIPSGLLQAISKVESGHKDDTGRIVAWPWTINAEGQGFFFPTKEEAIAAVRKMQLKGISSIDVGCMQVNLYHHPHAFRSLSEAFDPAKNVAYAARFLRRLKNEHTSWHKAVAHYHSSNPIHNIPYRKNVMGAWDRDLRTGEISLAAAVFEEATPRVNRIRRSSSAKTLSLKRAVLNKAFPKGYVRRVVHGNTRHIRKPQPNGGQKTLKVS